MKHSRLWPMLTGLASILMGSVALEVLARHQQPQGRWIEVTSNEDVGEDEEPFAMLGPFGPTQSEAHARARQLALRGEYEEATRQMAELVTEHPEQGLLLGEEGHYLLRAGKDQAALDVLRESTRLVDDNPRLWFDRGIAADRRGETQEALRALQHALQLRPRDLGIRISYGELLRRHARVEEAVRVLAGATEVGSNEDRARALASLGRCYGQLGDMIRADAAFKEAVLRAPASVNTWIRVARGYLQSQDPTHLAKAVEHALGAIKLSPESAVAHSLLGRAYERHGSKDEARDAYQEAIRLDLSASFPRKRLLRLALDAEDYRLARAQAASLLKLESTLPESHFLAGLVEARARRTEAARGHYQQALQLSPEGYPEAWFNLGLLERSAGRSESAVAAYQQAIKQRPGYLAAHNNLGLVYLDLEDFESAEASFRAALSLDPQYVPAWRNLARFSTAQGRFGEAVQHYEQALKLDPDNRSLRLGLAVALRKAGRGADAVEQYRALLLGEPNYVTAWYDLGIALSALGRFEEARDAYGRALAHDPDHLATLKNLGLLESRLGLGALAHDHLADALDRDPSDGELRLELAQLLLSENDLSGCRHAATLVLAQEPRSARARTLLDQCDR